MVEFKPAKIEESEILSNLAIESKGYWGYPKDLLELWRKDLRIEKTYIQRNIVRTIWLNAELVGFFALKTEQESELEHLWLRPEFIGKGFGQITFSEILNEFRKREITSFAIVSDPNAEKFYLNQGAKKIGKVESIPPNRFLPKLRYEVHC